MTKKKHTIWNFIYTVQMVKFKIWKHCMNYSRACDFGVFGNLKNFLQIWRKWNVLREPKGFTGTSVAKNPLANARDVGLIPSGADPWRRKWQPTPIFLPEKFMDRGAWRAYAHQRQLLKPVCPRADDLQQEKLPQRAAGAPRLESSLLSPQSQAAAET